MLLTWQKGEAPSSFLLGDFLTLLGAAAYALQIVLVEKFTKDNESLPLATIEMGTVALLSLGLGALFRQSMYPCFSGEEWGKYPIFRNICHRFSFYSTKKGPKTHPPPSTLG